MSYGGASSILELVASSGRRRPASSLPSALDPLFTALSACSSAAGADEAERRIWALWMYHPHCRAARHLDRAATEIATHCHDIAETRLSLLVRAVPEYAEAWNKQATLYYMQERDDECLRTVYEVLLREPRHFGAMCSAAEVLLAQGDREAAAFAFETALRIHPHLGEARQRLAELH